jgi:hypothetical protein
LGWIFFRAASFGDALAYLGGIAAPATGAVTVTPLIVVLIAFGLAIHALRWDSMTRLAERLRSLPAPALAGALVAAMLVVDAMRFEGIAPFIYFRF